MHKIIHSDFEIDLSIYEFTTQEENHWFSDTFFKKMVFPFDINLSRENRRALGYLVDHCADGGETTFDVVYVRGDVMEPAKLEVEETIGEKLSVSLTYGLEELPCFNKKLAELPLEIVTLPEETSIYEHAAAIIPQTWPAVNYNFPQVHTDKFDIESDQYAAFEEIFNNFKDGAFLENYIDEDVVFNRNIMLPCPYFLHVLTQGFLSDGKTLRGDILDDPHIKKKVLIADVEYSTTLAAESILISLTGSDGTVTTPQWRITFNETYAIEHKGRYRIIGYWNFTMVPVSQVGFVRITYRGTVLHEYSHTTNTGIVVGQSGEVHVNVVFDTVPDLNPDEIIVEAQLMNLGEDFFYADLSVNPVRLHDEEGNPIPTIINQNEVNLKRAVPDMLFKDLLKYLKNKHNLGLELRGSEVWMNFVQNEIYSRPVVDLSSTEIRQPARKLNRGVSFLLTFQEVEYDNYMYKPVFQNASSIVNSGYSQDDKTNEIILEGLTLPNFHRRGVTTAHLFETGETRIFSALYGGLIGGLNLTADPEPIMIPEVHARHSAEWFRLRIDSTTYNWTAYLTDEENRNLTEQSMIYAYGRKMITKVLNRTQYSPGLWSVELEIDAIK